MIIVRRSIVAGLATLGLLAGVLTAPSIAAASAPAVLSEGASGVTPFDAALGARVVTENEATSYLFEYAGNEALTGAVTVGSGSLSGNLEEQTAGPVDIGGGLTPGTTYYYRVAASNASGTTDGTVEHFTTLPAEAPKIEGQYVYTQGETTASLVGFVNPVFQTVTTCEFQYVTEATFNATGFTGAPGAMPCAPSAAELGQGDEGVNVSAGVAGLEPNTTYYYRVLAANATGTREGPPGSFLTPPSPPVVLTGEASAVTPHGATLTGSVNPGSSGPNSDTTYYFQWGTDTSYPNQIPLSAGDAGQGTSAVPETAPLTGLEPDTTYSYRIVASNNNNNQVVYGKGAVFKTLATPPALSPVEVAAVTQTTASFTASLQAQSLPTRYELQLGRTPGSLEYAASGNTSGSGAQPVALNVESLLPGTVYYYKLVAVGPDGNAESPEGSFATAPAPGAPGPAVQAAAPLFSVSPSAFPAEGAGSTTTIAPAPRALSTAQKLTNALKACRKKAKGKRGLCERQARSRYKPAKGRKKGK